MIRAIVVWLVTAIGSILIGWLIAGLFAIAKQVIKAVGQFLWFGLKKAFSKRKQNVHEGA